MNFTVDGINACKPVNKLLMLLQEKNFIIKESRIGDYHFNELYFLLAPGSDDVNLDDINIDKIKRHSLKVFYCECHWSIVEVKS